MVLELIFVPSPCEKVVIVPNTNCITSAIRKFTMEIPSPSSRGGGALYIIEDMDVRQGLSNPYPLQTNISAKFWTLCRQMAKLFRSIYSKTLGNEFLAVYRRIIEQIS